ncbi:hypothetical protein CYMTET_17461, partial [Cymbomonas tetramitiformis]
MTKLDKPSGAVRKSNGTCAALLAACCTLTSTPVHFFPPPQAMVRASLSSWPSDGLGIPFKLAVRWSGHPFKLAARWSGHPFKLAARWSGIPFKLAARWSGIPSLTARWSGTPFKLADGLGIPFKLAASMVRHTFQAAVHGPAVALETTPWGSATLSSLLDLLQTSQNFKIRTHAAAAVAVPKTRAAWGSLYTSAIPAVLAAFEVASTSLSLSDQSKARPLRCPATRRRAPSEPCNTAGSWICDLRDRRQVGAAQGWPSAAIPEGCGMEAAGAEGVSAARQPPASSKLRVDFADLKYRPVLGMQLSGAPPAVDPLLHSPCSVNGPQQEPTSVLAAPAPRSVLAIQQWCGGERIADDPAWKMQW